MNNIQELNIVDENDNIIGKDTRENVHKNGLLHREIHIWIYNKNSEILFQKRAKTKDTYPGLLDASVGGHVEIGDDYIQTAIKELKEETGINAEAKDLIYITTMKRSGYDKITGMKNNTIKKVFAYKFDGNPNELKLEEGEADSLKFWPISKILNLSKEEKKRFIDSIIDKEYIAIFNSINDLSKK